MCFVDKTFFSEQNFPAKIEKLQKTEGHSKKFHTNQSYSTTSKHILYDRRHNIRKKFNSQDNQYCRLARNTEIEGYTIWNQSSYVEFGWFSSLFKPCIKTIEMNAPWYFLDNRNDQTHVHITKIVNFYVTVG